MQRARPQHSVPPIGGQADVEGSAVAPACLGTFDAVHAVARLRGLALSGQADVGCGGVAPACPGAFDAENDGFELYRLRRYALGGRTGAEGRSAAACPISNTVHDEARLRRRALRRWHLCQTILGRLRCNTLLRRCHRTKARDDCRAIDRRLRCLTHLTLGRSGALSDLFPGEASSLAGEFFYRWLRHII